MPGALRTREKRLPRTPQAVCANVDLCGYGADQEKKTGLDISSLPSRPRKVVGWKRGTDLASITKYRTRWARLNGITLSTHRTEPASQREGPRSEELVFSRAGSWHDRATPFRSARSKKDAKIGSALVGETVLAYLSNSFRLIICLRDTRDPVVDKKNRSFP